MRTLVCAVAFLAVLVSGCGLYMNPTYSQALDRAVTVSDEMVARLAAMPEGPEKTAFATAAVRADNKYLHSLQDARDGKVKP